MPVSIRKNHYVPRILPKRAKRLASLDLSAVGKQNCHKVICHARFECHHPWRPVDVVANNPFACGSFDIFGLFWRPWLEQHSSSRAIHNISVAVTFWGSTHWRRFSAVCRWAHLYCTFETPDAHLQFNPASFIVHKCDSCEG